MQNKKTLYNLKLILILIFLAVRLLFFILIYYFAQLYQYTSFLRMPMLYMDFGFIPFLIFGNANNIFTGPGALIYGFMGVILLLTPIIYFIVAANKIHTFISYFLFIIIISWGYYNLAISYM